MRQLQHLVTFFPATTVTSENTWFKRHESNINAHWLTYAHVITMATQWLPQTPGTTVCRIKTYRLPHPSLSHNQGAEQ